MKKQRNQQDQNIPTEDYPHTVQYRERLQAKASRLMNKNPMAPIGTPATSAGLEMKSTDAVDIPRRPKKTRSPIRFPSPDEDESYNSSWGTPNLQPHIAQPLHFNVRPDDTTMDQAPRGSHSQTTSDITRRKRVFHQIQN